MIRSARTARDRRTRGDESGQSLVELIAAVAIFTLVLGMISIMMFAILSEVDAGIRNGVSSETSQVNAQFLDDLLRGAVSPANAATASNGTLSLSTSPVPCWGDASPAPPSGASLSASEARSLAVIDAHDYDVVFCGYYGSASSIKSDSTTYKGVPNVYEITIPPSTCKNATGGGYCSVEIIDWGANCNPGTLSGCALADGTAATSSCRPGSIAGCGPSGSPGQVVMSNVWCDRFCQGSIGAVADGDTSVAVACADTGGSCLATPTPPLFSYYSASQGEFPATGGRSTAAALNESEKSGGPTLDLSPQAQTGGAAGTDQQQVVSLLAGVQQVVVNLTELSNTNTARPANSGTPGATLINQVWLANQATAGYVPNCLSQAVLADQPTAYYQMDDPSSTGSTVSDYSGNNYTATAASPSGWDVSGSSTGPAQCAGNTKGMGFNGSSTKVTTPLTNWNPGTDTLSVAAWFQLNSVTGDNPRIVASDHTDSDNTGFQLEVNGVVSSGFTTGFFDVGNGSSQGMASWQVPELSTGTWYFYAGVYTGTQVEAFLDGQLVGVSTWQGGSWSDSASDTVAIGYNPQYSGDWVNGYIADTSLFTSALSATEIQSLYQSAGYTSSCLTAPMLAAVATAPPTAQDALFPLDDHVSQLASSTASPVRDVGPNRYSASAYEVTSQPSTQTPGPATCNDKGLGPDVGNDTGAMPFAGNTHVDLPAPFGGSFSPAQVTVEAWVDFSTVNGDNPRLVANDHTDTDNDGFQLMVNGGGGSGFFDVGNGSNQGCATWFGSSDGVGNLTAGTWYFYVGTYDGAVVRAYIDGQQVGSLTEGESADGPSCTPQSSPGHYVPFTAGAIAAPTTSSGSCGHSTSSPVTIGQNPCYGGDGVNGSMADVGIYPVALTGAQIQQEFQQATSVIK